MKIQKENGLIAKMEGRRMKHRMIIVMAGLAVLAQACSKEETNSSNDHLKGQSLTAVMSENVTKTAFSGTTFLWKKNDNLVVRSDNEKGYTVYTYKGEDSEGPATFEPNTGDNLVYGQNSFAIYPAKVSGTYPKEEDGSLKVVLKNNYKWFEGNVEAPMLAKVVSGEALNFKYLGGVLKLTIKNVPPKAAKLVVKAPVTDEALLGDGYKTYKITGIMKETKGWTSAEGGFGQEIPYVQSYAEKESDSLTVSFENAKPAQLASEEGMVVYVPLPVGPVENGGKHVYPKLTVRLAFEDGSTVPGSGRNAVNVQVERAHIKPMPQIALTRYKLTTLIGSAGRATNTSSHVDGAFSVAKLYSPRGITFISDSKAVVCDQNDAVMFVDLAQETVEKVSYNTISTTAVPWGCTYHNGVLYIVDKSQGRLYSCSDVDGSKTISYTNVSTGNYSPMSIRFSGDDAYVVIRDAYGLFKYAGGISGTKTKFGNFQIDGKNVKPIAFAVAPNGDFIVATADNGFRLYKVPAAGGTPVAVAGTGTKATNFSTMTDGPVSSATFSANVYGLAYDGSGNLYVGDQFAIRKITFGASGREWEDAVITTIISNGSSKPKDGYGADAAVNVVGDMAFNSDYSKLYITDQTSGRVSVMTIE